LELLLKAIELYSGDFLPNSSGEIWVMPLSRYYRSLFINCVHQAMELLLDAGRIDEAEKVCVKALGIDPFDEKILEYHLRSLIFQGKNLEALDEYKRMEAMFFDVMGVEFSDSLRSLYNHVQHPRIEENVPLEGVLRRWQDGADYPGAYYCDLGVFMTVYQIEARSASRSGRSAYVVRFDIKQKSSLKESGVMGRLGKVIAGNLRRGDILTRSGPNQYMLMLFSLTYENCKALTNRIIRSLDVKHRSKIIFSTSIKPIKPFE